MTIPSLAASTARTCPAVEAAVDRLVELRILEERAGTAPKTFRAREVVAATSRPPARN